MCWLNTLTYDETIGAYKPLGKFLTWCIWDNFPLQNNIKGSSLNHSTSSEPGLYISIDHYIACFSWSLTWGAQLSEIVASRGYRALFKDLLMVSRKDIMGNRIHMRGIHSIPIEISGDYYS